MIRLFIKFMFFILCVGLRPFGALSFAQEDILQDVPAVVAKPLNAEPVQDLHNLDVVKDLLTSMINPFLSKLPPESVVPEVSEKISPEPGESYSLDFPFNQTRPDSVLTVPAQNIIPQSVPVEPLPVIIDPPLIKLAGIIYDTTHPQALINDRIFSVGDEVDGIKVVNISKSGIVVEFRGSSFTYAINDRKVNQ